MKKTLTSTLVFLALLFSGCGKNNANNTTTPAIPPINTNPINTNPIGSSLDINSLRTVFENNSLATGVAIGDYYDEVSTSVWGFNFSISFFGKNFGTSSFSPDRFKVTTVDTNFIDLDEEGESRSRTIDRSGLVDRIFSDDRSDYIPVAKRGCVFTQESGMIPATVIEKYKEMGGGWYSPKYKVLVERVVVAPSLPLYLNPLSVETEYRTTFVKRFKVGSRVTNIVMVGNCR